MECMGTYLSAASKVGGFEVEIADRCRVRRLFQRRNQSCGRLTEDVT